MTVVAAIADIAQNATGDNLKRGYLAEPFDGVGSSIQVILSRGSTSSVRAYISAGSFGIAQTFPAGTPVYVLEYNGRLEVVSLGSKLAEGGITNQLVVPGGFDGTDLIVPETLPGEVLKTGTVSAEKLLIGGLSNLLNNPDFENGELGVTNDILGWEVTPVGSGYGQIYSSGMLGIATRSGSRCLYLTNDTTHANTYILNEAVIPLGANEKITVAAWHYYPNSQAIIRCYDQLGAVLGYVTGVVSTASSAWVQSVDTFTPLPGTAYVRIGFQHTVANTGTLIDEVSAFRGGVAIDSAGIVITQGSLVIRDEYDSVSQDASGFHGSWADFVALGLYNGSFALGAIGALTSGRTASLPYWTIAVVAGSPTITRIADSAYPSGYKVRVIFNAVNDEVTISSDLVPCLGGASYGANRVLGFNYTSTGSAAWSLLFRIRWFDKDGVYITNSGWVTNAPNTGVPQTLSPTFADTSISDATAPMNARFMQFQHYFKEVTAHDSGAGRYIDIGLSRIMANTPSLDNLGSYWIRQLQVGNNGDGYGYLSVGPAEEFSVDEAGTVSAIKYQRNFADVYPVLNLPADYEASATLTLSTTPTLPTGCTVTLTPPQNEIWLVVGSFYFIGTPGGGTNTTCIGYLYIDGTAEGAAALWTPYFNASQQAATVSQSWVVSLSGGTSHTVQLRAAKSNTNGTFTADYPHTKLSIFRLPSAA